MTTKEALHTALETLPEADLEQVAELVRSLQRRRGVSPKVSRLTADQAFRIQRERRGFRSVVPASGKGESASGQLIRERR